MQRVRSSAFRRLAKRFLLKAELRTQWTSYYYPSVSCKFSKKFMLAPDIASRENPGFQLSLE
jgi:hypothetical protein